MAIKSISRFIAWRRYISLIRLRGRCSYFIFVAFFNIGRQVEPIVKVLSHLLSVLFMVVSWANLTFGALICGLFDMFRLAIDELKEVWDICWFFLIFLSASTGKINPVPKGRESFGPKFLPSASKEYFLIEYDDVFIYLLVPGRSFSWFMLEAVMNLEGVGFWSNFLLLLAWLKLYQLIRLSDFPRLTSK